MSERKATKTVFKDPKNWVKSEKQWRTILQKTKDHIEFNNPYGFGDLEVTESAGYCDEFYDYYHDWCGPCPLYKREICKGKKGSNIILSLYCEEMQKPFLLVRQSINWEKAISCAQQIYDAILEDKPDGVEIEQ